LDEKLSHRTRYNTNIIHVNPEQLPLLFSSYPQATWNKRYHIGVWLWELEVFPELWHKAFNYLDEIWTPSSFTTRSIASVSPLPVVTIPYGIAVTKDFQSTRAAFGLPKERFLFLTMYDVNSTILRKNPIGAIDAFLAAFSDSDDGVGLVVKVNNAKSDDLKNLYEKIKGHRNIILLSKIMTKPQVNSLISQADALVSLHRSEGFGLVIAEAMYLGVPVIATNWSANTDFMDETNSCPVEYRLVDTGYSYYMSKPGQQWAEPSIEHAAQLMRRLYEDNTYRRKIALAGQKSIQSSHSLDQSAMHIKQRLGDIGLLG
jgi:glycosyltransferase involved in cell wall biosynthesis